MQKWEAPFFLYEYHLAGTLVGAIAVNDNNDKAKQWQNERNVDCWHSKNLLLIDNRGL